MTNFNDNTNDDGDQADDFKKYIIFLPVCLNHKHFISGFAIDVEAYPLHVFFFNFF